MKKTKSIYTAPACEAFKLEMEHATLQAYSTKKVMLNFVAFDVLTEGSTEESLTW